MLDSSTIIILLVVALVSFIGIKTYMDMLKKEYTDDRMKQTFASQSRGMEDQSVSSDFSEYQESIIEYIDSRLTDKVPFLSERIMQAGLKVKALEWSLMVGAITIIVAFLPAWFLQNVFGAYAFFFSLVLLFLVPIVAMLILNFQIQKRVTLFDEQFGVGLDVMSASMKAGGTFQ